MKHLQTSRVALAPPRCLVGLPTETGTQTDGWEPSDCQIARIFTFSVAGPNGHGVTHILPGSNMRLLNNNHASIKAKETVR